MCKRGLRMTEEQKSHWFSCDEHDLRNSWHFAEEDPLNLVDYRSVMESLEAGVLPAPFASIWVTSSRTRLNGVECQYYDAKSRGATLHDPTVATNKWYMDHTYSARGTYRMTSLIMTLSVEGVWEWTIHVERTVRSGQNKRQKMEVVLFTLQSENGTMFPRFHVSKRNDVYWRDCCSYFGDWANWRWLTLCLLWWGHYWLKTWTRMWLLTSLPNRMYRCLWLKLLEMQEAKK